MRSDRYPKLSDLMWPAAREGGSVGGSAGGGGGWGRREVEGGGGSGWWPRVVVVRRRWKGWSKRRLREGWGRAERGRAGRSRTLHVAHHRLPVVLGRGNLPAEGLGVRHALAEQRRLAGEEHRAVRRGGRGHVTRRRGWRRWWRQRQRGAAWRWLARLQAVWQEWRVAKGSRGGAWCMSFFGMQPTFTQLRRREGGRRRGRAGSRGGEEGCSRAAETPRRARRARLDKVADGDLLAVAGGALGAGQSARAAADHLRRGSRERNRRSLSRQLLALATAHQQIVLCFRRSHAVERGGEVRKGRGCAKVPRAR